MPEHAAPTPSHDSRQNANANSCVVCSRLAGREPRAQECVFELPFHCPKKRRAMKRQILTLEHQGGEYASAPRHPEHWPLRRQVAWPKWRALHLTPHLLCLIVSVPPSVHVRPRALKIYLDRSTDLNACFAMVSANSVLSTWTQQFSLTDSAQSVEHIRSGSSTPAGPTGPTGPSSGSAQKRYKQAKHVTSTGAAECSSGAP